MKLENLVAPLLLGLGAVVVAMGINKEEAKSGLEAATTYLIAVPIGITAGYLIDRFDKYVNGKGYNFSGRIPRP